MQCSLPDVNCEQLRPVFPVGPPHQNIYVKKHVTSYLSKKSEMLASCFLEGNLISQPLVLACLWCIANFLTSALGRAGQDKLTQKSSRQVWRFSTFWNVGITRSKVVVFFFLLLLLLLLLLWLLLLLLLLLVVVVVVVVVFFSGGLQ